MRPVPQSMTDAWHAEDKTGPRRPVVRATIQRASLQRYPYDTSKADGGDWDHQRKRHGNFTSIIFGENRPVVELRNIKSCSWNRSVDQDVATCTLVMANTELTPIGTVDDEHDDEFDQPGNFTYNRGWTLRGGLQDQDSESGERWGYENDRGWRNLIVPDRVVRTYEGYGQDLDVFPHLDPNLVQSGVWIIDKVTYSTEGDITVEMRDVGRLLLNQICFPPAIPMAEYPLSWSVIRTEQVPGRDAKGGEWLGFKGRAKANSSNKAYVGQGLQDPPYDYYVRSSGMVDGHHPNDALIGDKDDEGKVEKYWMSTGQSSRDSFVWWEAELEGEWDIAGLKIDPVGGPYKIYISIKTDDGWMGHKKIPYEVTTEDIDNDAKIPFVQQVWADRWNHFDVILKRKYRDVRRIRLTFTKLQDTRVGDYPWRARLNWVKMYTGNGNELYFERGNVAKVVGNYRDYTNIVKWICAWGGLYWPPHRTERNYYMIAPDQKERLRYEHADPVLPEGRVWGDFQKSGTQGEVDLTVDLFDKKPLMDVINYVRDILGFLFFIDETGAAIWRMPNIFEKGNYRSPLPEEDDLESRRRPERTMDHVTISEEQTLLNYSTTLDSESIRERIFVANSTGKVGVVIRGYNPTYEGYRRTAGWTDQNFKTKRETIVMADMIAARQMFNYRRSSITTPGYPAIQIDDQIRVFERVTNETFFHYVLGIESELNMEEGTWTYDLSTHWLGERRADAWVVEVEEMDEVTQNYLGILTGTSDMED